MNKILGAAAIVITAATSLAQQPPTEAIAVRRLVTAALERTRHRVTYDGAYRRIPYPALSRR